MIIETDEIIEFVKKYPQFKNLIEYIIFKNQYRNVVNIVPIDEYLAEN